MSTVASICRLCTNGCPILVEVDEGRVTRVTGDPAGEPYRGYTCVKGRAQPDFLHHPDRLRHLVKRGADGRFHRIELDRAIDEIATRLSRMVEQHRARSVALYWGTMVGASPVMTSFVAAFAEALGPPREFNPIAIDKPGRNIARALHGSWSAPRQAVDEPQVALLVGINPLVSYQGVPVGNPGKWLGDAMRRGMSIVVVDPRRSDVAKRATIHLQCRPVTTPRSSPRCFMSSSPKRGMTASSSPSTRPDSTNSGTPSLTFLPPTSQRRQAWTRTVSSRPPGSSPTPAGDTVAGTGPAMSGPGTLVEYLVLCLETVCGHWLRAGERVRNPGVLLPTFSAVAQATPPTPAAGLGESIRRARGRARRGSRADLRSRLGDRHRRVRRVPAARPRVDECRASATRRSTTRLCTGTSLNRLLSVDADFDRYSGQPRMSNLPITVRRVPTVHGPAPKENVR